MADRLFSSTAKWCWLSCLVLLAAVGFWFFRPGPAAPTPAVQTRSRDSEIHYVTPQQLTDSAALRATSIPLLTGTSDRDESFSWPQPDERRPLLLVFIKSGCPCSVDLEPYFHRLHRAYSDMVRVVGVIDADVPSAQRFRRDNSTPYPILADSQQQIIRRFRAENGAYVALVVPVLSRSERAPPAPPGAPDSLSIDCLWPGCSAELFAEMGRRIAAAAGVAERPFDCSGLPSAPITGCPFASSIP
jgi:peroxiredoxin